MAQAAVRTDREEPIQYIVAENKRYGYRISPSDGDRYHVRNTTSISIHMPPDTPPESMAEDAQFVVRAFLESGIHVGSPQLHRTYQGAYITVDLSEETSQRMDALAAVNLRSLGTQMKRVAPVISLDGPQMREQALDLAARRALVRLVNRKHDAGLKYPQGPR